MLATRVRLQLLTFLAPLLCTLDQQLDRRLVVTFVEVLQTLLIWRHRTLALLLSGLGSYLAAPGHALAGTKRLSNLLRSERWQADLIATYLWRQAVQQVAALRTASQEAVLIWDDSVLEKAKATSILTCAVCTPAKPAVWFASARASFSHPSLNDRFVPHTCSRLDCRCAARAVPRLLR
jgi:hypothetical protein